MSSPYETEIRVKNSNFDLYSRRQDFGLHHKKSNFGFPTPLAVFAASHSHSG